MVQPKHCERGLADAGRARRDASVAKRLARLERMVADPALVARLTADGRYLRLCAAIAWASATVERTRERLDAGAFLAGRLLH